MKASQPTKIGRTMISSRYSEKKGENEKALVTKEMALSNLMENIFIGDSAATSHMTSNKLGVYNLIPINRSVILEMGKASAAPIRENWMSSASTRIDR